LNETGNVDVVEAVQLVVGKRSRLVSFVVRLDPYARTLRTMGRMRGLRGLLQHDGLLQLDDGARHAGRGKKNVPDTQQ
jgi:hypothetical protein